MTLTSTQTRIPTVVLYDIMTEAATRVRGTLVALQTENPSRAADCTARRRALTDLVDGVDPDDRDTIQRVTNDLRAEFDRLNAA